jgi:hypothetical protein
MLDTRARSLSSTLILLVLAAVEAQAQGFGGNFADPCIAKVSASAHYLGKQSGQDTVEVSLSPPGGSGFGGIQANVNANRAAVCGAQEGLTGAYRIALTIERRLGHRDSGSSTVNGPLAGSNQERNIQVPRAALETDPKTYEITVDGPVLGTFTAMARAAGNGVPAIPGATLSNTTNIATLTSTCVPSFAVTALGLASPTALNLSWSAPSLAALCLKHNSTRVDAKLVRPDGTTVVGHVVVPAGATFAQVPLNGPAGDAVSYEVTVSVLTTSTLVLHGNAEGAF